MNVGRRCRWGTSKIRHSGLIEAYVPAGASISEAEMKITGKTYSQVDANAVGNVDRYLVREDCKPGTAAKRFAPRCTSVEILPEAPDGERRLLDLIAKSTFGAEVPVDLLDVAERLRREGLVEDAPFPGVNPAHADPSSRDETAARWAAVKPVQLTPKGRERQHGTGESVWVDLRDGCKVRVAATGNEVLELAFDAARWSDAGKGEVIRRAERYVVAEVEVWGTWSMHPVTRWLHALAWTPRRR